MALLELFKELKVLVPVLFLLDQLFCTAVPDKAKLVEGCFTLLGEFVLVPQYTLVLDPLIQKLKIIKI